MVNDKNLKFYTIKSSMDPKVVGPNFTQLALYGKRPRIKLPLTGSEFPECDVDLKFSLLHKAKWTDFLSQPSMGGISLTLSQNMKNALEQFNLGNHKFYKADFLNKNGSFKDKGYWLAFSKYDGLEFIDYTKSNFVIQSMIKTSKKVDVTILSAKEYRDRKSTLSNEYSIRSSTTILRNDIDVDMFYLFTNRSFYISEVLSTYLLQSSFTGFEIY